MHVEALLEYFHLTCKPAVADMCESARVKLLSNVDVAATEAMVKCQDLKNRLNACLLDATQRFHMQIADHMAQIKMPWPKGFVPEVDGDPDPRRAWIDFPAHWRKLRARTHATRVTALAVPTPLSTNPTMAWIELPWKAWLEEEAGLSLRDTAGGRAAVAAVLRALHKRGRTEDLPITIMGNGEEVRVITTMAGESGAIMIPPCVPQSMMRRGNRSFPRDVRITYQQTIAHQPITNAMFKSGVVDNATHSVFVMPEFSAPEHTTTAPQASRSHDTCNWILDGTESMHPYWAVRRLTRDQIIYTCTHDDARITLCRIKEVEFYTTSGVCERDTCSTADDNYAVRVPMLTNAEKFCEGMELVIEVDEPAQARIKRNHACEDDKGGDGANNSPHTYATPAAKKLRMNDA